MWTRRQFGWWTSVVLLAPGLAAAEPEAQTQQQAVTAPSPPSGPLDELTFAFEVSARSEREILVAVSVTNTGKKGHSVSMHVRSYEVTDGKTTEQYLAWMNDNSPLSRRVMPPAFVDLPAHRTLAMGNLTLTLSGDPYSADKVTPDQVASVVLEVVDDRGKSRQLALAPFSTTAAVGDAIPLASAADS